MEGTGAIGPVRPEARCRAVVRLEAIVHNYRVLGRRGGGTGRVIPVLKADAYGHGAVPLARRLSAEGADVFAVAIAPEGIALRRAGATV